VLHCAGVLSMHPLNALVLRVAVLVALAVSLPSFAQPAVDVSTTMRAARAGSREAQYRLGEMYDLGQGVTQDYRQAVVWYLRAAKQGYAPAQFALAEMYKNGDGVAKDLNQAVTWYRRAASNGSAGAQLLLGVLYEGGTGVKQDLAEAARWYRRSAEGGDARAQMMLANLYATGQGVPRDPVAAYALYSESLRVDAKNNPSLGHRAQLARSMKGPEIEAGQRLAAELAVPGKLGAALERATAR
jgi:TPR repeat protein